MVTGRASVVSTAELRKQRPLDALFISPWLLASARAARALPGAARVIVYHHQAGERVPPCPNCLVPRQRQVLEISGSSGNTRAHD